MLGICCTSTVAGEKDFVALIKRINTDLSKLDQRGDAVDGCGGMSLGMFLETITVKFLDCFYAAHIAVVMHVISPI